MPRPINPYIAGNPVGNSPAFIGRDRVLHAVLSVLRDPRHHGIVLYGQRRIGKTSILQHLAEWLPREGGPRAIYFDLQDKAAWSVGKIAEHLAFAIADALGLPEPEPGLAPESWFQHEWLPSVLGGLAKGESVVILFDEFDVLADVESQRAASATFFGYLREMLASTAPRLGFVFVIGRNLEDLSYLAQPLFKALPAERISLLSQSDAEALMRMSEVEGSLSWSDEAIAAAWALTHGHPYLLQHLCWQVWQRAHEGQDPSPRVRPENMAEAIPRTLDASGNALEWLWRGLPSAGRVVASALAEAGAGAITQEALHQMLHDSGVRVVIRELRDAPLLLQEWDLIEPIGNGYQFRVELLRRWIAQFKPLGRVQQELDQIQPLAENLYKTGVGFYKAGDLERSLEQLRQATRINPNHLRASELLAEILISREEWGEARRLLDGLHDNHPAAARPRLIQVLLAQAQRTMDEEEELDLFERVLALEAKNSAAIAGRQRIWREAGDRARSEGELEDARAAYRQAGLLELEKSVLEEIRATQLASVVEKVEALEGRGEFEAALDMLRRTGDFFAGLRSWESDIARLERASVIAADYQRATGALQSGDRKAASELLAKVIAIDPGYKEAAARLYEAVSGVNVEALRRRQERLTRFVWAECIVGAVAAAGLVVRLLWGSVPYTFNAGTCPKNMAWIPGGMFQMGSDEFEDEKPPHQVKVTGFCMDLTEVTVEAYSSCVNQDACKAAGAWSRYCNGTRSDRQDHPVNCVDWSQAESYCKAQDKRLPTEQEWEYVAHGGDEQRRYPWGDTVPTNHLCWPAKENDLYRYESTCPTGKYPKSNSKWGLSDLAGNVWEWTSSPYCPYHGKDCRPDKYVLRGGGWFDADAIHMRATRRLLSLPTVPNSTFGFRCAKTP